MGFLCGEYTRSGAAASLKCRRREPDGAITGFGPSDSRAVATVFHTRCFHFLVTSSAKQRVFVQTLRTFRRAGYEVVFGTNLLPMFASEAGDTMIRIGDVLTVNKRAHVRP